MKLIIVIFCYVTKRCAHKYDRTLMFILVRTLFLGLFNIPDKAKDFIGKESFDWI